MPMPNDGEAAHAPSGGDSEGDGVLLGCQSTTAVREEAHSPSHVGNDGGGIIGLAGGALGAGSRVRPWASLFSLCALSLRFTKKGNLLWVKLT